MDQGNHRVLFWAMVRSLPPQPDHPLASLLGANAFDLSAFNQYLALYLIVRNVDREKVVGEVEREAAFYWQRLLETLHWFDKTVAEFIENRCGSDRELLARVVKEKFFQLMMAHSGQNASQAYMTVTGFYCFALARTASNPGELFPRNPGEAAEE